MILEQLIVAACAFFACWYLLKKRTRLPNPLPGTRHPHCLTALPVVGSLPFLKSDPKDLAQQLMEKSKSLGSILALYLGSEYVVVLNDTVSITDALVKKSSQFADRRPFYTEQNHLNINRKGVAFSTYNDMYRRKHQLYLSILKRFGFGYNLMETNINGSIEHFIREAKNTGGRPFDPAESLSLSVVDIIANIMLGRRYPHGHRTLVDIKNLTHQWVLTAVIEIDLLPLLRFVPPYRDRMKRAIAVHQQLLHTLDEALSEVLHDEETAVKDDDNDSFIRNFIESTKSSGTVRSTAFIPFGGHDEVKQSKSIDFDREELIYTLRDVITGGIDTSVTTLRWFLLTMANNPEVQSRMRKEIDDVVGRDRPPSLADEQSMPYSQAVMLETMRRYTLLPLSLFRSTTCDTSVGGVFIPASTMVIVNLHGMHMDSTRWGDPSVYRPERFLDDNGEVYGKDRVIAFSLGKRSCLGEMLARQELFLYMTGIVQNFDIRPPEDGQTIAYETKTTVTAEPTPFEIRLLARLP